MSALNAQRWLLPLVLLGGMALLVAHARAATPITDFSGAWQRDDSDSDDDSAIEDILRREATQELAPQLSAPAAASSSASPPTPHGGGHGGGHGMGGGGGGGMGGGHGGGKRGQNADTSAKTPTAPISYPLPPQLDNDSLLLVQQDADTVQVRLDSGEVLNGRLDGHTRQSLNGSAMVSTFLEAGGLTVTIQYADGSRLQQHWARAVDGHHLTVYEQWKIPSLQQAIIFKRRYNAIN